MSIFKSDGIILQIKKVGEKDFLYTIFTKEFGKIRGNKKISSTEKTLDIGYHIGCEISTSNNGNFHKIRNIKIKSEFPTKNASFQILNSYLELIAQLNKNLPDGLAHSDIFKVIACANTISTDFPEKLLLAKLKAKSLFGELSLENNDPITAKILKFIAKSSIQQIFKLTGIQEQQRKNLEQML